MDFRPFGIALEDADYSRSWSAEAATAHAFSRALFEEGLCYMGIGFPTVAEEKSSGTDDRDCNTFA